MYISKYQLQLAGANNLEMQVDGAFCANKKFDMQMWLWWCCSCCCCFYQECVLATADGLSDASVTDADNSVEGKVSLLLG